MAGLCAAARARQLGLDTTVLEKGDRAGGSMRLSSGVIWRYRSLEDFRRECPAGDARVQQQIIERLDEGLEWLESIGARPIQKETANPRTVGWRFDPRALTDALVRVAGRVELGRVPGSDPGTGPLVLATGGFGVRLARERGLALRSNPWSSGDGLDLGLKRGAATTEGMDEFYGRAMPAPPARWGEGQFVDHAQLYGRFARITDEHGAPVSVAPEDWSENGLVQEIARRGGLAWYLVGADDLGRETPYGSVAEVIERARGAVVRDLRLDLAVDSLDANRDPRRRPASDRLVDRLADDLVEADLGLLGEAVRRVEVEVDLDLVREANLF